MRREPTWRIPAGVLGLCLGLLAYALLIARYLPGLIGGWPGLAQAPVYLLLGIIWLLIDQRKQGWHDMLAGTVVVRPKTGGKTVTFE